jgi:hypothetical protein
MLRTHVDNGSLVLIDLVVENVVVRNHATPLFVLQRSTASACAVAAPSNRRLQKVKMVGICLTCVAMRLLLQVGNVRRDRTGHTLSPRK